MAQFVQRSGAGAFACQGERLNAGGSQGSLPSFCNTVVLEG